MSKVLLRSVFLLCVFALLSAFHPVPSAMASQPQDILQELNGTAWKNSTANEKLAFLYGSTAVVGIEHTVAKQENRKPSVFAAEWSRALSDKSLEQLMAAIDTWYLANPGQESRNVFDVIWYELIQPRK